MSCITVIQITAIAIIISQPIQRVKTLGRWLLLSQLPKSYVDRLSCDDHANQSFLDACLTRRKVNVVTVIL